MKSKNFPEDLTSDDLVTVHYLAKYSYEELQHHLEMADRLFNDLDNQPSDRAYRLSGKTWEYLRDDEKEGAMKPDFKVKQTYFKMTENERQELKILQQCEKRFK